MNSHRPAPLIAAAILSTIPLCLHALNPLFEAPVTNPFGLTSRGFGAAPEFADIDGDGDRDLLCGGGSFATLHVMTNTGNAFSPAFAAPVSSPFGLNIGGTTIVTPALVDIDGDNDFDFFFGDSSGIIRFQRNTGNSTNPLFGALQTNPFGLLDVGQEASPVFADFDFDGDFDLLVNRLGGEIWQFTNTGNATNPLFSAQVQNPHGLATLGNYSLLDSGDLDGDGRTDLLRGSLYSGLHFCRNTGSPFFENAQPGAFGLVGPGALQRPSLVDIDGDGDLDVFSISTGAFNFFRNTPDVTPPAIASFVLNGPTTTDADLVSFGVTFTEPVGNSFTSSDLLVGGPAYTAHVTPNPADPSYTVLVQFVDPDANGGVFLVIPIGSVSDLAGNSSQFEHSTAEFTIANFPSGDVSKNGAFDLADVALLADANLGLATLP